MTVKVLMLKDYYPTEYIDVGVWWKGDVIEIDEVEAQVSVDFMVDEGICEIIEEDEE